jgi:hypothetical protein
VADALVVAIGIDVVLMPAERMIPDSSGCTGPIPLVQNASEKWWPMTFPEGHQVSLTRISGLGVAVAASLATITAGPAPAVAHASVPGNSMAPAVTYYTGTPGLTRLVPRTVHAAKPAAGMRALPRGARRLPAGHFSATEAAPRAPAVTAAAAASSPQVNINGVSSLDSQVTNYNLKFEPPDQGLCKGNGFVLEAVNSAYRIYDTAGKSMRGPFNINDLFNVGGKEFTSDPRCWFDPASQTWFTTVIFLNDTFTRSALLVAVRQAQTRLGCGTSTRSTQTTWGTAARASLINPGLGLTSTTYTSPTTSSRSAGRSSWAQKCGRSTRPSWSQAPRACISCASPT